MFSKGLHLILIINLTNLVFLGTLKLLRLWGRRHFIGLIFFCCFGESFFHTWEPTLNILPHDLSELWLGQVLANNVLDAFIFVNVPGARLNWLSQFKCLRVLLHARRCYRFSNLGITLSWWISSRVNILDIEVCAIRALSLVLDLLFKLIFQVFEFFVFWNHLSGLLFKIENILLFFYFEIGHSLLHLHLELIDSFPFLGWFREQFLILLQVRVILIQLILNR